MFYIAISKGDSKISKHTTNKAKTFHESKTLCSLTKTKLKTNSHRLMAVLNSTRRLVSLPSNVRDCCCNCGCSSSHSTFKANARWCYTSTKRVRALSQLDSSMWPKAGRHLARAAASTSAPAFKSVASKSLSQLYMIYFHIQNRVDLIDNFVSKIRYNTA